MDKYINNICTFLYGSNNGETTAHEIDSICKKWHEKLPARPAYAPDEKDAFLITYGNSIVEDNSTPLATLNSFLKTYAQDIISTVHILPFYPYSSDDGFSVIDYRKVNPELGDWNDIQKIAAHFHLGADAVFNHISAKSDWFKEFLNENPTFQDWFISLPPDTDLSKVTRARSHPLLSEFTTAKGNSVHLWTTFSADQIDLNVTSPAVLTELTDILFFYIANGVSVIRLDAIAFLWKELGTTCIHLPQTHAIIKLWRHIINSYAPHVCLLIEANVPHRENIAYFGEPNDEAQMVYQFPLPPLTAHAILTHNADILRSWIASLEPTPPGTTFLNFLASHDGIGLRPTTGYLDSSDIEFLCNTVTQRGGNISYKMNSDGTESPYEMNINYLSLFDTGDSASAIRCFLLAHSILMCMPGIPALYIHSLLGSINDTDAVEREGYNRAINRAQLSRKEIEEELSDPTHRRARVFYALSHMLRIRRSCALFSPRTEWHVPDADSHILIIQRGDDNDNLLAIHNLSEEECTITLPNELFSRARTDILSGKTYDTAEIELNPYQFIWLK